MPTVPRQPSAPYGGAILGSVTAKEKLKAAVDRLTEAEAASAEIVVRRDPVAEAFENAPLDDEPWTEADEAAIAEADADRAAGVPTIPLEQVERELGIE